MIYLTDEGFPEKTYAFDQLKIISFANQLKNVWFDSSDYEVCIEPFFICIEQNALFFAKLKKRSSCISNYFKFPGLVSTLATCKTYLIFFVILVWVPRILIRHTWYQIIDQNIWQVSFVPMTCMSVTLWHRIRFLDTIWKWNTIFNLCWSDFFHKNYTKIKYMITKSRPVMWDDILDWKKALN